MNFADFGLKDMASCGAALRHIDSQGGLRQVAGRVATFFQESFSAESASVCALVRVFRTQDYAQLEVELQELVQARLGYEPVASMKCLVLLATVGVEPSWNDTARSHGHRVIPFSSPESIESAPMLAELFRSFGLSPAQLLTTPQSIQRASFQVFHVAEALGSPSIPAQEDFVKPYEIRSVLGFGGLLGPSDLFATLLFSRVPIPAETAELFRPLALTVRETLSRAGGLEAGRPDELLEVYESCINQQVLRLDQASGYLNAVLGAATGTAIIATDTDGTITLFNSGAEAMLGYSAMELVGIHNPSLFHDSAEIEARGQILSQELGRTIQGFSVFTERCRLGGQDIQDWIYIRKDGSRLEVRLAISSIQGDQDSIVGYLGTATDVSQVRAQQRALQESQDRLRDILENSSELILSLDPHATVRYANRAWRETLGYSDDDVLGRPLFDFVDPECSQCKPAFQRVLQGHQGVLLETVMLTRNGHRIYLEGTATCRVEAGCPQSAQLFLRDVSESRRIKEYHDRFFQLSLDPLAICNFEGQFIQLNPVWESILGYPVEELLGRPFLDFVHPDDLAKTIAMVETLAQAHPIGTVEGFENRYRRRDGSFVWLLWSVVSSASDRLLCCVARDITERKAMEAALASNHARLETILKNVVDGIITIDSHGLVQSFNRSAERLFGYTAEDVIGCNVSMLMPDPYASRHDGYLHNYRTSGQARIIGIGREVEGRRRDGSVFPMDLAVGEAVEDSLFVGVVRDLSERNQLQETRRRLSAIIEQTPDAVGWADAQGRMVYLNPSGQQLLGLTLKETVGRSFESLQPEWASRLLRQVALPKALQDGVWEGQSAILLGDGSEVPVAQSVIVHRSPDGQKVEFFSTIFRDLRKQLQTQEDMRKAQRAAEGASQAKSEFLAGMSHELRTPLNAIIGFSEFLVKETFGPLNPKQTRYANNIARSGRHLLQIINDILDLSKIEAGHMQLDLAPVNLPVIIQEAVSLVAGLAEEKGLHITSRLEVVPEAMADKSRLQQVLFNLLSNAIKFTPDGGHIEVSVEVQPSSAEITVSVADSGIGIDPKDQDRIFREFEQVDSGYARKQQGTGLGLALTKRLVELQGGTIGLTSELGNGSRFFFTLNPVVASSGVSHELNPARPRLPGETLILVVEDDRDAREILGNHLSAGGYRVVFAHDGEQALEMARRLIPHAITLDIMIPKLDGWSVLEALKADLTTRHIPVLVVSMVEDRRRGFSLGAVESVLKPVDRDRLVGIVSQMVRSHGALVLIIDDNAEHATDLIAEVSSTGFRTLWARSGSEGLELAARQKPDAVLLNLLMQDCIGFETADLLATHADTKNIPVLGFTSRTLSEQDRNRISTQVQSLACHLDQDDLLKRLNQLIQQVPGGSHEDTGS